MDFVMRARVDGSLRSVTRPAGAPSEGHRDDAGELTTSARVPRGGDAGRAVDARERRARERALVEKVRRQRLYRHALDEQLEAAARGRARAALAERSENAAATAASERAKERERAAVREMEERRRMEYVAALDRQVAERRERERRRREEEARRDAEENARIARAVEEEREILRQKRAAMEAQAVMEAARGEERARSKRVTHSPPASPRPSPREAPPPLVDVFAEDRGGSYTAIPEYADRFETSYEDIPTAHVATGVDAATASELASIIRELVIETRDLRERLARAEDALAARDR